MIAKLESQSNPSTFLKSELGVDEIAYCINDCLVELELFAFVESNTGVMTQQTKSQ